MDKQDDYNWLDEWLDKSLDNWENNCTCNTDYKKILKELGEIMDFYHKELKRIANDEGFIF